MAYDLESLCCRRAVRPPRIVLLGVEKIGKSTFAAGAPNPVFIPVTGEEGIDDLDVVSWESVRSFTDVIECISGLYSGKHDRETVVIDSASALEPIVWEETCKKNPDKHGNIPSSIEKVGGGYYKGYTEALTQWKQITDGLDALRNTRNMASIIIGHVRVKRFDDPAGPSYDQYQFDINEKATNLLYRWADAILFCNTKVAIKSEDVGFGKEKHVAVDISGGQRWLYTQKKPAHPGGGRGVYGRLPYELPLSWAAYQQAIANVVEQAG